MRILLAARYTSKQRPIGGVQSWIDTIAAVLRENHEVVTWGRGEANPHGRFDLGIIANWCDSGHLAALCDKTISVSHGIIEPEKPGPADVQLFTSEKGHEYWKGNGDIIRQPISTDFWSPVDCEKKYLTRFSYRAGLGFVPQIAQSMGLEYRHVRSETPEAARDILRQSAVALCTGRAALEAMAVGVPVVICDHRRGYMPPLMDIDTLGSAARNYSGRGGIEPTMLNVLKACRDAIKTGSLRAHVERHHDVRDITNQLLKSGV